MQCASSLEVVVADFHFIGQLLSSEDQTNLSNLDALLLLQRLLDLQDGVVALEVEALFSSCQSLYGEKRKGSR